MTMRPWTHGPGHDCGVQRCSAGMARVIYLTNDFQSAGIRGGSSVLQ